MYDLQKILFTAWWKFEHKVGCQELSVVLRLDDEWAKMFDSSCDAQGLRGNHMTWCLCSFAL